MLLLCINEKQNMMCNVKDGLKLLFDHKAILIHAWEGGGEVHGY